MKRLRHRSDLNQAEIIDALRKIGATVYCIGEPFDLLVWYRQRWHVIEIKGPDGRFTEAQVRDMALLGDRAVAVVKSVQDAIYAVCDANN